MILNFVFSRTRLEGETFSRIMVLFQNGKKVSLSFNTLLYRHTNDKYNSLRLRKFSPAVSQVGEGS